MTTRLLKGLLFLILISLCIFEISCQQNASNQNNTRVDGKIFYDITVEIENYVEDDYIRLAFVEQLPKAENILDADLKVKEGKIILKGSVNEGGIFSIKRYHTKSTKNFSHNYFLIDKNSNNKLIKKDWKVGDKYEIKGSKEDQKIKELNEYIFKQNTQLTFLNTILKKESFNFTDLTRKSFQRAEFSYDSILTNQELYIKEFISQTDNPLLVYHAASSLFVSDNHYYLSKLLNNQLSPLAGTKAFNAFKQQFDKINNDYVGKKAFNFSAQTLEGKSIRLGDFKNQYVLLNFWASWCGKSNEELAYIADLNQNIAEDKLAIINISLDQEKRILEEFLKKNNISLKNHICDEKIFKGDIALKYGIYYTPINILINKEGIIEAMNFRQEEFKEIEKIIP